MLVQIGILGLQLIWHFLHFIVSSFYFVVGIATTLESYLISCGFLRKYNCLNIDRVQHLAIVVESDEAYNTLKIIELLQWLASLGIRSVCLYDVEGNDFWSIQEFWVLFYCCQLLVNVFPKLLNCMVIWLCLCSRGAKAIQGNHFEESKECIGISGTCNCNKDIYLNLQVQ